MQLNILVKNPQKIGFSLMYTFVVYFSANFKLISNLQTIYINLKRIVFIKFVESLQSFLLNNHFSSLKEYASFDFPALPAAFFTVFKKFCV